MGWYECDTTWHVCEVRGVLWMCCHMKTMWYIIVVICRDMGDMDVIWVCYVCCICDIKVMFWVWYKRVKDLMWQESDMTCYGAINCDMDVVWCRWHILWCLCDMLMCWCVDVIWVWYGWHGRDMEGIIMMWFDCDMHGNDKWYGCDMHVIWVWYACDMGVICMWYGCDMHVIWVWYA